MDSAGALASAQKALQLAQAAGNRELAATISEQIGEYRAQQPTP